MSFSVAARPPRPIPRMRDGAPEPASPLQGPAKSPGQGAATGAGQGGMQPPPPKTSAAPPDAKIAQQAKEALARNPKDPNPSPAEIRKLLSEAAERNQIPPEILMAIAFKESNWRHYNRDGSVLRGQWTPSDVGIMQINEKAHPAAFPRARTDMRYNIEYGARYLKWQFERYGNWEEAVAAYNSGSVVRRKNGKLINHNYYDTVNRFAKDFMREPYEMPRT